jgi:uncharacterized protein (DUF2225 family)
MQAGKPDEKGGASNFQPPAETYDDRIECNWCGRKFNETVLDRHAPVCETKFKANEMKNKGKPQMGKTKRDTSMGFRGYKK